MTQEDKKLLLKDLCARLPYGVKIALKNSEPYHHENVAKKGDVTIDRLKGFTGSYFTIHHDNPLDWSWYESDIDVEDIKPYLFPISSMTEEQKNEYRKVCELDTEILSKHPMDGTPFPALYNSQDWLNAHRFDYRGLIEKGLALDATNLNIYKDYAEFN
jgi:hypothetical protein